jgi:hypothetical protein
MKDVQYIVRALILLSVSIIPCNPSRRDRSSSTDTKRSETKDKSTHTLAHAKYTEAKFTQLKRLRA